MSKGPKIPSRLRRDKVSEGSVGGRQDANASAPPAVVAIPRDDVPLPADGAPVDVDDAGRRVEEIGIAPIVEVAFLAARLLGDEARDDGADLRLTEEVVLGQRVLDLLVRRAALLPDLGDVDLEGRTCRSRLRLGDDAAPIVAVDPEALAGPVVGVGVVRPVEYDGRRADAAQHEHARDGLLESALDTAGKHFTLALERLEGALGLETLRHLRQRRGDADIDDVLQLAELPGREGSATHVGVPSVALLALRLIRSLPQRERA